MAVAVSENEAQDLRRLIPLNMLSGDRFEQLCSEVIIEDAPRGSVLFSKGDTKSEFVYVLKGTISLQADGMEMETITGGTESARFALAHQIPRKVSAVAKDKVRFIRVESAFVNQSSTSQESRKANYEVREVKGEKEDDWVTTLLSSPIFQRLSPANLQQLLRNLEEIKVEAGQQIIHQDDPGDYYYVIKQGRCALSRKPSKTSREIKLAELKTCDTFGEDSLISDQPRNVTITMLTDGSLLRLNKANFLKLVKEPVISYVDYAAAQGLINNGARWLDVRPQDEFNQGHLPGAINIPFFVLRMELGNLSRDRSYVLACAKGRVSEAAAFLLIRNSFDAFVLRGGLESIPDLPSLVTKDASASESTGRINIGPASESSLIEYEPGAISTSLESMLATDDSSTLDDLADSSIELIEMTSSILSDSSVADGQLSGFGSTSPQNRPIAEKSSVGDGAGKSLQIAEQARIRAESRVRVLEAKIAELSSVVQEFVEQQANGESDDILSIRTELEMVRSQASADVMSLQTKLRTAEQEVTRLRHELDGTYAQVLQLQSGVDITGAGRGDRKNNLSQVAIPLVAGIVAFIVGMVLALAIVRSTEFGRSLLAQQNAVNSPIIPLQNQDGTINRS